MCLYIISISIVAYFITQHLEAFYKYLGISQLHVFLLSGYGLYASLQIKGTAYTDTFVKRKVVPYYKVLCMFVGIYFLFRITQGTQTSIWEIFKSLTFGGTIIGNGWYLQVQLVLYLLFYVVFGLIHQKKLVVMVSTCISFCICLYLIGYEATWYEGIMAFPLGMVWCAYHDRLFFLREKRKSMYCKEYSYLYSIMFR